MLSDKVFRWALFGGLFSAVPFALAFIILCFTNQHSNLEIVFGDGGLFLVVCTMALVSASELVGSSERHIRKKLFSTFCAFVIAIVSALLYGLVLSAGPNGVNLDAVIWGSIGSYLATIVVSLSCVRLSEKPEKARGGGGG